MTSYITIEKTHDGKLRANLHTGRNYRGCITAERLIREGEIGGQYMVRTEDCESELWAVEVILGPGVADEYLGEGNAPCYLLTAGGAEE